MSKTQVLQDVKEVLGFVPNFVEESPEEELVPMWGLFKDLVLKDTAIPRKHKTLIELATAATLHDKYRIHLSTEMAKSQGISAEEIREAVTLAELTNLASTWLNGYQINLETFKDELRRMLDKARQMSQLPPPGDFKSREDVEQDIEKIFGFVPEFLKEMPDVGVKYFWQMMRGTILGETHIPNKYRELIGLAVASVISCRYCIFFHTESAKLYGASREEIKETVLLAARIRSWGVMMYGTQYDYDTIKKESRKLADNLKRVPSGVR